VIRDFRIPGKSRTAKIRVSSRLYFKFNVENEYYAIKNGGPH
jgi:hypothetical protein